MKTFSVVVAVAIVLTVMCSQQSSAVPVQGEEKKEMKGMEKMEEMEDIEESVFFEVPGAAMDESFMESMTMLSNRRKKDKMKCRFCCKNRHCGVCCTF